ncbi:hypothetical protein HYH03_011652 [Edaphochlamys debaryana]|uniref:Ysc84 actin-binding domain-containing protein n=1 Tax=Edaphochlamys debaryana TaxID=47281 RepID=A0A836BW85_9CHLO|nr:hypothetical protein HYH03_011652 [Edaphochlamys debaryana]|eukprot:KAG2489849.1 hypothetical protein HYH03_011652 [Edaphochlamys debaryana]
MSLHLEDEINQKYGDTKRVNALDAKKNPLLISILDAVDTLKNMQASGKLPQDAISTSKGLLTMMTNKVGFGVSVTQGYGLVVARLPNSPTGWSAPLPIKVDGFSVGAVMGYSEQHTVISLATDNDIQAFLKDKRAMKIGMDFGLNLGDKVDKSAAVNTQTGQTSDSGAKTRCFTIAKGMMVDVSMQGTSVEPDVEDMANCYGQHVTPGDILTGKVSAPREAMLLYNMLKTLQ